jgi:hypothetical protein
VSGGSLKGLRFDTTHWGNVIVPAPGMHELRNVLYLEVAPDHIETADDILNLQHYQAPEIDCPLQQLPPPNLQVLKLTPEASGILTLWENFGTEIRDRPHLRKIFLGIRSRNRDERRTSCRHSKSDHYKNHPELFEDDKYLYKGYPCYTQKNYFGNSENFARRKVWN